MRVRRPAQLEATSPLRRPGVDGPPASIRSLLPPSRDIEGELKAAERSLARRPGTWPRLESVGRARRALGRSGWREMLSDAAQALLANPLDDAPHHLHIGNLLLLAGQESAAAAELETVVAALAPEVRRRDPAREHLGVLLPAAFVLCRDDLVGAVVSRMTADELGPVHQLGRLAAADRSGDAKTAHQIAHDLAGLARTDIIATSGPAPSVWDIAEMAAEVAARAAATDGL